MQCRGKKLPQKRLFFHILITIHCLILTYDSVAANCRAVCKVPVADVFFEKLSDLFDCHLSLEQLYSSSSLCGDSYVSCPRGAQILFNESCEVVAVEGEEVCIALPHILYNTVDRSYLFNTFWTHKNNVHFVDESGTYKESIPYPLSASQPLPRRNSSELVLVLPWREIMMDMSFSIGTRFVRYTPLDNEWGYGIRLYDFVHEKEKFVRIPHTYARILAPATYDSEEALRSDFVSMLRSWCLLAGTVPYVWGGCSLTGTLTHDNYSYHEGQWHHPEVQSGCTGFDCSLMIMRAAQICGIPYFFKNSHTLSQYLRPLDEEEKVQPGDILWYEGHVLIIADVENNTVIETCGQPYGFGKMHEIALSKRFKGIQSYDDLLRAYKQGGPLYSMHRDGFVKRRVNSFKIFSLLSIW